MYDPNKKYHAVIEVDDDRWAKHPFGYTVYDEEDNVVATNNFLDTWDDCYKVINQYHVYGTDIKTEYY